jgi:rod shape-determining protein MreC
MTEHGRLTLRVLLLWLLLELIAAAQVVREDGVTVLAHWTRTALLPATWTAQWISRTASDLYQGSRDFERVIADLKAAREEAERLRARNVLLLEDLRVLREATDAQPQIDELAVDVQLARCTYRNLALGLMQIRATGSGAVYQNTAAISGSGLVGRVIFSEQLHTWVQVITHPASAVAVRTEDVTVEALATGSGPGELEIEYVPRTANLLRGTTLVTSGADGIYPPGIPVATVTRIRETDAPFLEVRARPLADLATVRVVLLLPEWSRVDRPGSRP